MAALGMGRKIAVLGAGAIGSSVAADLTKAGYDITVIDQWPAQVLARVHAELVKAIQSPELRPKIEQQDMDSSGPPLRTFNSMYYAELKRWTKVAKDVGLKAD